MKSSSFRGLLLNLLDEWTKFAFYRIKIRLETLEIKFLSVALLSSLDELDELDKLDKLDKLDELDELDE